jgi:hypothetical protein
MGKVRRFGISFYGFGRFPTLYQIEGGDALEKQKNAPYVKRTHKGLMQYPHRKTEGFLPSYYNKKGSECQWIF